MNKKIAVFCGAHSGSEKIFSEHAHEVGKLLADAKSKKILSLINPSTNRIHPINLISLPSLTFTPSSHSSSCSREPW